MSLRARYDAAIDANRQLYRELQAERERREALERRVGSLVAMLSQARESRDLWRHRATTLPRSAGAPASDSHQPLSSAGRNPPRTASAATIASGESRPICREER